MAFFYDINSINVPVVINGYKTEETFQGVTFKPDGPNELFYSIKDPNQDSIAYIAGINGNGDFEELPMFRLDKDRDQLNLNLEPNRTYFIWSIGSFKNFISSPPFILIDMVYNNGPYGDNNIIIKLVD